MPARGITTDCTAEEEDGASGTVRRSPQRASGEERRRWRWKGGEGEGRCPGETCSCKCVIRPQAGEGGREEHERGKRRGKEKIREKRKRGGRYVDPCPCHAES